MKKVALAVSAFLGAPVIGVVLYILFGQAGLSQQDMVLLAPLYIMFLGVLPLFYIYWAVKLGKITDLDLTNRKERIWPLTIIFIGFCACLYGTYLADAMRLFSLILLLFLIYCCNMVITFYWKISLHMALNIMMVGFSIHFYGVRAAPLLVLIPIVYWSRRSLDKHTHAQLITSMIMNAGLIFVGLRVLGL